MILVDTTVIIDLWRGFLGVKNCLEQNESEQFCISAITIEEVYDGLGYTRIKKGLDLCKEIRVQLKTILADFDIIPISLRILERSGFLKGKLRAKGIVLDVNDCIVGATAQIIKAKKIITRNPDHFKPFKVTIETYELK